MSDNTAGVSGKTNVLAIVGLIAVFVVAPVGAILGHVAKGQMRESGEKGQGLAQAAVILGWLFTGIIILVFILSGMIYA
jgi:hypothetical protein